MTTQTFEEFCSGTDPEANNAGAGKKILVKSPDASGMLGVESGPTQEGIRPVQQRKEEQNSSSSTPDELGSDNGSDTGRDGGLPQMRQPSLREADPLILGNAGGKPQGHDSKGTSQGEVFGNESLHEGPPTKNGPENSDQNKANLPNVRERAQAQSATISTDETGALVAKTFEDRYRMARIFAASKLVPQGLDTPEKVFTALQFAHELGLKGYTALRNICVVNGNPSLWGDLPLAIVRNSGKLASLKEWVFDANGKEICPENANLKAEIDGAACKTVRRDGDSTSDLTTWFTVADAKFANLWGTKVWKVYPRRMLQMRARSQNLKDHFGDALCGSAIAEYDFNATGDERGEILVESTQGSARSKLDELANGGESK